MATPRIPADAEPVAVWDARSWMKWPWWHEANAWATEHIQRVNDTYRAEFYMVDLPFAVLYRFALNENGRCYLDHETGEAAIAEPVLQVLDSLPPSHLLGAH